MKTSKELSAVTMWRINCYSGEAVRGYFHGISNLMQIIWRCCTEAVDYAESTLMDGGSFDDGVGDNADSYPDDPNRTELDSYDSASVVVQNGIWLLLSMLAGFYDLWGSKQS